MGLKVAATILIVVALAGCAETKLEKRVSALEMSVGRLETAAAKVDAQMNQLGKLSADLEAERAYFRDVKEYVRLMRDDTVTLIDDQRKKVEEGREEYLRILRREADLLQSLQGEVNAAMGELEKKPVAASVAVPQPPADPAFKAAGGSDSR